MSQNNPWFLGQNFFISWFTGICRGDEILIPDIEMGISKIPKTL